MAETASVLRALTELRKCKTQKLVDEDGIPLKPRASSANMVFGDLANLDLRLPFWVRAAQFESPKLHIQRCSTETQILPTSSDCKIDGRNPSKNDLPTSFICRIDLIKKSKIWNIRR